VYLVEEQRYSGKEVSSDSSSAATTQAALSNQTNPAGRFKNQKTNPSQKNPMTAKQGNQRQV